MGVCLRRGLSTALHARRLFKGSFYFSFLGVCSGKESVHRKTLFEVIVCTKCFFDVRCRWLMYVFTFSVSPIVVA